MIKSFYNRVQLRELSVLASAVKSKFCKKAKYIHDRNSIRIFISIHYVRVYDKLTIDYLSMWLGSSMDKALHRYRKVVGSNPVQASLISFFQVAFSTA